jgi:hypothetical protein
MPRALRFFFGFFRIRLTELQIDPHLESTFRTKALGATFHMECYSSNRIFHMDFHRKLLRHYGYDRRPSREALGDHYVKTSNR